MVFYYLTFPVLQDAEGLMHPEFRKNFNYMMSIAAEYNYYTKPEYIDEIGTRIMKKYLPQGGIEDMDTVEVIFLLIHVFKMYLLKKV